MKSFSWIVYGVAATVAATLPFYVSAVVAISFTIAMAVGALCIVAVHEDVAEGWIADICNGDIFGFHRAERESKLLAAQQEATPTNDHSQSPPKE